MKQLQGSWRIESKYELFEALRNNNMMAVQIGDHWHRFDLAGADKALSQLNL